MDQPQTTPQDDQQLDQQISQAQTPVESPVMQKIKQDFASVDQTALNESELAEEMAKKPTNPLEAILEAEQKKELRLNDARKTLNTDGKTKEEIHARYPGNPFESN